MDIKKQMLAEKTNNVCTVVKVGNVEIGRDLVVIGGPCTVESSELYTEIAIAAQKAGANILRGGVFKPRTSPYSFQGLGREGLKILDKTRKKLNIPIVTEVMDTRDVEIVAEHVDMLQVGSRNMTNFSLLTEVGKSGKPVLLKRSMSATIDEWINCAEYIIKESSGGCVLCERGIRTFENSTRNTMDLSAIPVAKSITHLPIIVDPSHGTGIADIVEPMSLAAIAAGADGVMLEVHQDPQNAVCDGQQSITPLVFEKLILRLKATRELLY